MSLAVVSQLLDDFSQLEEAMWGRIGEWKELEEVLGEVMMDVNGKR